MKKDNLFIIIVIVGILVPGILAIPQTLSLHGKLTNNTGSILTGTYNMTFKIYNSSTGGSSLWTDENQTITVDSDGIYNFILKDVNLTFTEQYYLGIAVESDFEMTPRINLTSAPYTFRAQNISAEGIINDSNIDLTGKNITASSGLFSWLGSLANRITKIFATDINASGNVDVGGNLTVGERVGIGTGSPAYLVDIQSSSASMMRFHTTATLGNGGTAGIRMDSSSSVSTWEIYHTPDDGLLNIKNRANMVMQIENNAPATSLYINSAGNLGINTTTPQNKLNVIGDANITGTSYFTNASFNGGWENNGVSISDGDLYAQTIYVYNITSLNVTKQNLTIIDNLTIGGHLFSSGTGDNYFMGNLGIGTVSPSQKLDVTTADGTNDGIAIHKESRDATHIEYVLSQRSNNEDFWIYGYDGTTFKFPMKFNWSAGYTALGMSGDVGIGTVSPSDKLDVDGNARFTDATNEIWIGKNADMPTGAGLYLLGDGQSGIVRTYYDTTNLTLQAGETASFISKIILGAKSGSDFIGFYTQGSERMRINGTGNVGIGTTNPLSKLDVRPSARTTAYNPGNYYSWSDIHTNNPTDTENAATGISFSVYTSEHTNSAAGIGAVRKDSSAELDLVFITRPQAAASSERMRIDSTGNVGIGTTNPLSKLDINQSGNTMLHGLTLERTGTYRGTMFLDAVSGALNINRGESAGTGLSIKYGGNVGIGTTNPDAELKIQGDIAKATDSTEEVFKISSNNATDEFELIVTLGNNPVAASRYIDISSIEQNVDFRSLTLNKAGGNVGIGTTTPDSKLTIETANPNATTPYLNLLHTDIVAWKLYGTGTNERDLTIGSGTPPTDLFTIQRADVGGYVGIGTTSPDNELQVVGTGKFGTHTTASGYVGGLWDATDGFRFSLIGSTYYNGSDFITNKGLGWGSNNVVVISADATKGIVFYTNASTGNTQRTDNVTTFNAYERMRIDKSGNVGIGTASPSEKLEVNGTGTITLNSKVRAKRSTAQSIQTANYTKVQYNIEDFDTNGEYDNVTNYRFTAKEAGYYKVTASLVFTININAGELVGILLYKNGAVYSWLDYSLAEGNAVYKGARGSDLIYLNGIADYMEIFVYQTSGATVDFTANDAYNYLSIVRVP